VRVIGPRVFVGPLLCVSIALAGVALAGCGKVRRSADVAPAPLPRLDAHVHVSADAIPRLLRLMDAEHIEQAINLSGGVPGRTLERQLEAARSSSGRIIVFTTLAYGEAVLPGYGARMAAAVRRAHALGAKGLKIAKVLGLGLRNERGERLAVDDPELDVVFEAAGELAMPVAIHTGDPEAFWLPVDLRNERRAELLVHPGWSLYGKPVPSFEQLHEELMRRVARHPRTTFISVHFGNLAEHPERVANELRTYPNLYIDTAARIPEIGRKDPKEMRAFFEEFQDRILFGTDLGVGPEPEPLFLGSSGDAPPTDQDRERFFRSTTRYFETEDTHFASPTAIQGDWTISGIGLPRPILEKLYSKNARRILGL
jgi:predicted TIM-barrel fold metal-dependent hydrolase